MRRRKSVKKGNKFIVIALLLLILVGIGYVYTAPEFERQKPVITSQNNLFWNRKDPLKVELQDNFGLKSFELILSDGTKSILVAKGDFKKSTKVEQLLIKYPKNKVLNSKAKKLRLKVIVTDSSKWNFFKGNRSEKVIDINIDTKLPNVNVLSNSYSITQGGSALVVFQAEDDNLDKLYIKADGKIFNVEPYRKEGYFVSLIAWPFKKENFKAKIIAIDKAGNKRVSNIPLYLRNYKYKVSWIKATDKFIDGKITDLALSNPDYSDIKDRLKKLKAINETMRLKNEELIHKYTKNISSKMLKDWKIKRFYPLKNSKKVASYGDERHYYYQSKNNEVSTSYHVGYDLASVRMANIRASNAGKVVFANENGIYGNMPIIDHGLGLYTLYGHCSKLLVKEGDEVKAGEIIAKTGTSGLALGDHLHFGILVQGIEVRPIEWFDKNWIKNNIADVFKEADRIIGN